MVNIAERDARVIALTQVAGRMLHDFNNYLTPIKGYLGLFKEECAPETNLSRYAGLMEKAADKIESNLGNIAASVRPERSYRPSSMEFHSIVKEAIAAWTDQFAGATAMPIQMSLTPCVLMVDAPQWHRVVFHLLDNARLACIAGGAIEARLTRQILTCERMQELGLTKQETCLFEIADTGCGMTEDVLSRAMDPFFSTRIKEKAVGLGLTQVFNVTRIHGGQILVDSQPNAGTTVSIWLPL